MRGERADARLPRFMSNVPFRAEVLGRLRGVLGEPFRDEFEKPGVYHWRLRCEDRAEVHIDLTLETAESPGLVHVLISDPARRGSGQEPLVSIALRSSEQLQGLLAVLREKVTGCW